MQKVKVIVGIEGDHCSFDEVLTNIKYDLTNNISHCDYDSSEELYSEYEESDGYSDIEERDAILLDGVYYVEW